MAPGPVEELALLDLERSNKGASKQRRDQINGEIGTMRDLLPLQESSRQRLSQLQIMSLACVYIRKCNVMQKMLPTNRCSIEVPCEFSSALTGFVLVATRDGKLVYISENVTEYLGHSMVDMKTQGDSLFDIVDKRDHGTVQAQLLHGIGAASEGEGRKTSFFCRMNMSRTLKRQGGFGDVKVMHVKGRFVPVSQKEGSAGTEQYVFMALCSPLITPDVKESLIQNNTTVFKSVHKLDMSFIELTETGEFHLGMKNQDIGDRSWYSMLHPEDLAEAKAKHIQLIKSRHEMGCMMTVRMLTSTNDVIWVNIVMHVRQALVSNNDDPVIVCINQVVSEEEAKQFKIQGQLFALYASRAPDIFFGGHHYPQLHQSMDPEMLNRHQAYLQQQQQGYLAEQQRFQPYATSPQQPGSYAVPTHQYAMTSPAMEMFGQRTQGHNSTIKALKRKLQENFISSCKPNKMAKVNHGSMQGDDNDYVNGGDSKYLMDVDIFNATGGLNHMFPNGNSVAGLVGGNTMPMVYQAHADPTQAIRAKKAMLVNAIAPVGTPDIVQKLAPTCTLEQVVPDVKIPECYLTPDPSPSTSPEPRFSRVNGGVMKKETHEIKQLTSYVMDRLSEMKQTKTTSDIPATKVTSPDQPTQNKKKNLPVIDATFVDDFFDDLVPGFMPMEVKREPMSPEPVVPRTPHNTCTSYSPNPSPPCDISQSRTSSLSSSTSTCVPLPPTLPIKEELTFEDCTDLEELFGLVASAGSEQPIKSSYSSSDPLSSPVSSPESFNGSVSAASPMSVTSPAPFGSPLSADSIKCAENMRMMLSPGSSSPGHEDRNDLLDTDSWLLEPISLSLEMALPELEPVHAGVKMDDASDDLYHIKQLLQQSWAPCGVSSSHKTSQ